MMEVFTEVQMTACGNRLIERCILVQYNFSSRETWRIVPRLMSFSWYNSPIIAQRLYN